MSPARKKKTAARKPAARKAKAPKKPARKATATKKPARKATAKSKPKAATKTRASKPTKAAKALAKRKAPAPPKASKDPKAEARAPAKAAAPARRAPRVKSARPRARSRRGSSEGSTPLFASGSAASATHARLGVKYECFDCGAKFYDLNRPEPLCPKCGADQRKRPKADPKARPSPAQPRRPRADSRMAPLLDDEEVVAPPVERDALDLGLVESSDAAFAGDEEESEEEESEES